MRLILPSILLFCLSFTIQQPVYATYCFENLPDGTSNNDLCGLASGNFTKTFTALNAPQDAILSGFGLIILWGGIIGIIWFKTERIDIVGIVGLVVAGTMVSTFSAHAIGIGLTLLFVDLGILAWQLIRQRVTIFS